MDYIKIIWCRKSASLKWVMCRRQIVNVWTVYAFDQALTTALWPRHSQIYVLVQQARNFGTAAVQMLKLQFVQPFSHSFLKSLQYIATEYSLWNIYTKSRDLYFWKSDTDNIKCISHFCNANKNKAESIHPDKGYLLTKIFILLRKDTFELKDIFLYLFNFQNKCFLTIVRETEIKWDERQMQHFILGT